MGRGDLSEWGMRAMEHRYKDVRDQAKDWHSVPVDGGYEPDKAVSWVEHNTSGEWTWKSMPDAEVKSRVGRWPGERFYLEFLFAKKTDYEKCSLQFGDTISES